ncbi:unnamed protein product, partial [Durusdinium trenchii]
DPISARIDYRHAIYRSTRNKKAEKRKKYKEDCASMGVVFEPFVMTSFSGFG